MEPEETVQGSLKLMYDLDVMLSEILGMEKVCLHPAAGAHGELTALMVIKVEGERTLLSNEGGSLGRGGVDQEVSVSEQQCARA